MTSMRQLASYVVHCDAIRLHLFQQLGFVHTNNTLYCRCVYSFLQIFAFLSLLCTDNERLISSFVKLMQYYASSACD